MKLNVKVLKGEQLSIEVESDAISVLEVKNLIAEKIGIPVGKQSLVFKGKTLTDSQNLRCYRIQDGAKLFLATKSGAPKKKPVESQAAPAPAAAAPQPVPDPLPPAPQPMETQSEEGAAIPFRTKPFTSRERARNEISSYFLLLTQVLRDYFSPEDLLRVVDFFLEEMVETVYSINMDGVEYMATECLRIKNQGSRKEVVGLAAASAVN